MDGDGRALGQRCEHRHDNSDRGDESRLSIGHLNAPKRTLHPVHGHHTSAANDHVTFVDRLLNAVFLNCGERNRFRQRRSDRRHLVDQYGPVRRGRRDSAMDREDPTARGQ